MFVLTYANKKTENQSSQGPQRYKILRKHKIYGNYKRTTCFLGEDLILWKVETLETIG